MVPFTVVGAIWRLSLTLAVTDIPVTVTCVFIENHANDAVLKSTAEMRRSASAEISFFMCFYLTYNYLYVLVAQPSQKRPVALRRPLTRTLPFHYTHGAGSGTWTRNLWITKPEHYRLCYPGIMVTPEGFEPSFQAWKARFLTALEEGAIRWAQLVAPGEFLDCEKNEGIFGDAMIFVADRPVRPPSFWVNSGKRTIVATRLIVRRKNRFEYTHLLHLAPSP